MMEHLDDRNFLEPPDDSIESWQEMLESEQDRREYLDDNYRDD